MRIAPAQALVVALAAGYGIFERTVTPTFLDVPAEPGVWDVLLGVTVVNPYLTAYVVLPVWIIAAVVANGRELIPPRILRHGSRWRVALATLARATRTYLTTTAMVIAALLIVSIGLDAGVRLPLPASAAALAVHGIPPLAMLVGQVLVTGVVLLAICLLFITLRLTVGRPAVEVMVGAAVFCWTAVSSTGWLGADLPSSAVFTNLTAAFAVPAQAAVAGVVVAVLVVSLGVALRVRDTGRLAIRPTARGVALVVATALLALATLTIVPPDGDLIGATGAVLFGSGSWQVPYLIPTLIAVAFALLFALETPSLRGPMAAPLLLRHGTRGRWASRQLLPEVSRAAGVSAFVAATIGVTYIAGGGSRLADNPAQAGPWAVHLIVNSALQMLAYAALVIAMHTASIRRTVQVVVVAMFVPIGAFVGPDLPWVPVGAAGLGRLTGGWVSVVSSTIGLAVAIALGILATHLKWRRS